MDFIFFDENERFSDVNIKLSIEFSVFTYLV